MSKRYEMNGFDDFESDDLGMLGSRFLRVASRMDNEKLHRARHESDARDERSPKRRSFRPRERMRHDESY